MDKKSFLASGLLEKYALGLASPEECDEVVRHLKSFPELNGRLTALQSGISDYARKQGIPSPPKSLPKLPFPLIPAVSGLLLISSLVVAVIFYQQKRALEGKLEGLAAGLENCRQNSAKYQSQLESGNNLCAFLNDTASLPLLLLGKSGSRIIVYWNEPRGIAKLKLASLPVPPENKQYQAWADIAGEMVPIGLLEYQFAGWQNIHCLENARSVNVTLEPQGGSDHPSLNFLYANANIEK